MNANLASTQKQYRTSETVRISAPKGSPNPCEYAHAPAALFRIEGPDLYESTAVKRVTTYDSRLVLRARQGYRVCNVGPACGYATSATHSAVFNFAPYWQSGAPSDTSRVTTATLTWSRIRILSQKHVISFICIKELWDTKGVSKGKYSVVAILVC